MWLFLPSMSYHLSSFKNIDCSSFYRRTSCVAIQPLICVSTWQPYNRPVNYRSEGIKRLRRKSAYASMKHLSKQVLPCNPASFWDNG